MNIETIFGGDLNKEYQSLYSLFEQVVTQNPNAIALTFESRHYTYAQLFEEIIQCIDNLKVKGVRKGNVIGLHLARSDRYAIIAMAIFIGGFVYLPLAIELPDHRLAEIVGIAQPKIIVSDSGEKFPKKFEILSSDSLFQSISVEKERDNQILPESLCYIIFTSGTTGKPKGVEISHKSFFNRLIWAREYYDIGSTDVLLCKTPFTFDPSIQELVLPLISGARLLMADPMRQAFPNYLIDCIVAHHVTMMIVVPSLLRLMLQSSNLPSCSSLRHIVCCGEPWGVDLISEFHKALPNGNIYNGYGPTETTIGTLVYRPPKGYNEDFIPIGAPINGVHVALIGENHESVKTGEVGELIIGGVCVCNGYIRDKVLTESKFKTLIVKKYGAIRFYFSGDLAKELPSGDILFLGRKDNQVKVNGVRIELEEIENILKQHEIITDAVVLKSSDRGIDYLHAFFTSSIHEVDLKMIRVHCQKKLNPQTVPAKFSQLKEFPTTQNGKIDRKKTRDLLVPK